MDLTTIVCILLALIAGALGFAVYTNYQKAKKRKELMNKVVKKVTKKLSK